MNRIERINVKASRRHGRHWRRTVAVVMASLLVVLLYSQRISVLSGALKIAGYPRVFVDKMVKYPEAAGYALGYPFHKDKHVPIDVAGEVTQGEIPLFLQWDERWGYEMYGSGYMGVNGCGPTCLSMVQCGLSGDTQWDPYAVACMAQGSGYYIEGVGSSWDLMQSGAESLGLDVYELSINSEQITAALQNDIPIICSMRPGDFTYGGHFIVLSGLDERGKVIVRDLNSNRNSEKTWDVDTLIPQIKGLWGYSYASASY